MDTIFNYSQDDDLIEEQQYRWGEERIPINEDKGVEDAIDNYKGLNDIK